MKQLFWILLIVSVVRSPLAADYSWYTDVWVSRSATIYASASSDSGGEDVFASQTVRITGPTRASGYDCLPYSSSSLVSADARSEGRWQITFDGFIDAVSWYASETVELEDYTTNYVWNGLSNNQCKYVQSCVGRSVCPSSSAVSVGSYPCANFAKETLRLITIGVSKQCSLSKSIPWHVRREQRATRVTCTAP